MKIQFGWHGEEMYRRMQKPGVANGTLVLSPEHVRVRPEWRGKSSGQKRILEQLLTEFNQKREAYLTLREKGTSVDELRSKKQELAALSGKLFLPRLNRNTAAGIAKAFHDARTDLNKPGFLRFLGIHDIFFNDLAMAHFLSHSILGLNNRLLALGFPLKKNLLYPKNSDTYQRMAKWQTDSDHEKRKNAKAWLKKESGLKSDHFRSVSALIEPKGIDVPTYYRPWPGQVRPHVDFYDVYTEQNIQGTFQPEGPLIFLGYPSCTEIGKAPNAEKVERSLAVDFKQRLKDGLGIRFNESQLAALYSKSCTDHSVCLTPTQAECYRYRLGPDTFYGTIFLDSRIAHAAAVDKDFDPAAPENAKAQRRLLHVRAKSNPMEYQTLIDTWFGENRWTTTQRRIQEI